MRKMFLLLVLLGCKERQVNSRTVFIPDTKEGKACLRECMLIWQLCESDSHTPYAECADRQDKCLITCPDASYTRPNDRPNH